MSDPPRLFDVADSSTRSMIAAAAGDAPSRSVRRETSVALGLGTLVAATTAGGTSAAAGASATGGAMVIAGAGTTAIGKWLAVALVVGGASGGIGYVAGVNRSPSVAPAAQSAASAPSVSSSTDSSAAKVLPLQAVTQASNPAPPSKALLADEARPPEVRSNTDEGPGRVVQPHRPPVAPANHDDVAPEISLRDTAPDISPRDIAPADSVEAPPPAISAPSLARETAALYAVSATLRAGDPAQAVRALDDFTHAFPDGALAPEATALRVDALMQLGDPTSRASADRLAAAFLRDHPRSPLAARVRSLVGHRGAP